MTEEQKAHDFEVRRKRAIELMNEVLVKEELGIELVLGGYPRSLQPMIHYTDLKKYEEAKEKQVKKRGR